MRLSTQFGLRTALILMTGGCALLTAIRFVCPVSYVATSVCSTCGDEMKRTFHRLPFTEVSLYSRDVRVATPMGDALAQHGLRPSHTHNWVQLYAEGPGFSSCGESGLGLAVFDQDYARMISDLMGALEPVERKALVRCVLSPGTAEEMYWKRVDSDFPGSAVADPNSVEAWLNQNRDLIAKLLQQ